MYHGRITKASKKRKYNIGREAVETTIGEEKKKKVRTKGGGNKLKLISSKYANVVLEGKNLRCEILSLVENPANKEFTRRKIITKGAIISVKTPDGKEVNARVTSRPGQAGVINAVSV
ncbi:MAG: 30S ribosomal protein S8e [Candidatus Altiarchaeales archaeon]|nr:MAG: 30S ribosomal protein S8e [Candidatus Altiarchaeales archaeon]